MQIGKKKFIDVVFCNEVWVSGGCFVGFADSQ